MNITIAETIQNLRDISMQNLVSSIVNMILLGGGIYFICKYHFERTRHHVLRALLKLDKKKIREYEKLERAWAENLKKLKSEADSKDEQIDSLVRQLSLPLEERGENPFHGAIQSLLRSLPSDRLKVNTCDECDTCSKADFCPIKDFVTELRTRKNESESSASSVEEEIKDDTESKEE